MPTDWRLTKKAKRIMSMLNTLFGTPVNSNTIAQGAITSGVISPSQLAAQNSWNNAAQQNQLMNAYPYTNASYRALHLIVKQVENGYTVEIGGSTHIASDLKEITDLLTNRVAATLLEWNP
jgi:hypothetical protein